MTVETFTNAHQYELPLVDVARIPLTANGLSADAMPLAPGYVGEDRNAAAREETVNGTMGWSQRAADLVIAHPPEAVVPEQLTAAERARRHLAALGLPPTDPATRPATTWRNHVGIYSR
jgi:hypothetical protein